MSSIADKPEDKVGDLSKWGVTYTGNIYSGYLSASDDDLTQFHYMFYPSPTDSATKPVMIWLNGGPGCSSL